MCAVTELLNEYGVSRGDLCNLFDIGPSTITSWTKTGRIPAPYLVALDAAAKISRLTEELNAANLTIRTMAKAFAQWETY